MTPAQYKVIGAALAVLALILGGYVAGVKITDNHWQARWNANQAAQMQAALTAEQAARGREQFLQQKIIEAQNAATDRETKLRADANAASAAAHSLRDTIAALRSQLSTATPEASRNTADTALVVFNECADRYRAVAEAADGLGSDRQTLMEAWPR